MASLTDAGADSIVDDWLAPQTLYLALFTTATNTSGGGTEAAGGGYARQPISLTAGNPTANDAPIAFSSMVADDYTHAAIMDAVSGGTMLLQGPLTATVTAEAGDDINFDAGEVTWTVA